MGTTKSTRRLVLAGALLLTACRDGTGPPPEPVIAVSAAEASFRAARDGPDPPEQALHVTNAGGGALGGLAVEVAYAPGEVEGWLTAALSAAAAPATLTLAAATGEVAPGVYTATVLIRSPAAANSPRSLTVRFELEPAWTGPLRWERVEGTPMGGDVRALWGDAATLLAAGERGVVVRSGDGGGTWSMTLGPISPVVSGSVRVEALWGEGAVAIASTTHNYWHAGPIFTLLQRSTDRGATWREVPVADGGMVVRGIWGEGSTVVLVGWATSGGGRITRSTDAGATWSPVAVPATMGRAKAAVWGEGATVVAVGERGSIHRSADGGASWVEVPSGTEQELLAVWGGGSTWVAAGAAGTLLRSVDGGLTWSATAASAQRTLRALAGDGSTILAVGDGGTVLRSTDAGATWSGVESGTDRDLFAAWRDRTAWVVGGATGTLLRSPDGAAGWTRVARGPATRLSGVWGQGSSVIAVGEGGTIRRSTDAGASWSAVSSGVRHDLFDVWGEGATFVAVGGAGTILRSADAGATWSSVASATSDSLLAVWGAGSTLIAVGTAGTVVRSTDQGASWAPVSSGTPFQLAGICGRGSFLLAVGTEAVRSEDGGATWVRAGDHWLNAPDAWCTRSTLLTFANSVTHTTALSAIRRSTDDGRTWLTAIGVVFVDFRRFGGIRSTVFAVGYPGLLYRSLDEGATWQSMGSAVDQTLRDVWVGSGRDVIVVGDGGVILRGRP
jgi:photosystem II stability/assembly factor-like uncharacterized protein